MELFGGHYTPVQMTVLALCAFLGGFTKTGIVGLGIVITPLMASAFPAGAALGMLLPIFLVGDIISVSRFNAKVPWRPVLAAVPWGVAGTAAGWLVAGRLNECFGSDAERVLRMTIGVLMALVVVLGAYLAKHPEYVTGRGSVAPDSETIGRVNIAYAALLGLFSGFASMLTNSGGPIWAVYFSSLDLEVREVIAGGVWSLFICNAIKMPLSANLGFFSGESLTINLILLPVLFCGLVAGRKIADRYSRETFARIIRGLAACGACYMIVL